MKLMKEMAQIKCNRGHTCVFQIKYKETYRNNKERAAGVNMSDSRTLHHLQAAKINSNVSRRTAL